MVFTLLDSTRTGLLILKTVSRMQGGGEAGGGGEREGWDGGRGRQKMRGTGEKGRHGKRRGIEYGRNDGRKYLHSPYSVRL